MDHCLRLLEEIGRYQEAEFLKGNVNIMANPELKNCPTNLSQIKQKILKNQMNDIEIFYREVIDIMEYVIVHIRDNRTASILVDIMKEFKEKCKRIHEDVMNQKLQKEQHLRRIQIENRQKALLFESEVKQKEANKYDSIVETQTKQTEQMLNIQKQIEDNYKQMQENNRIMKTISDNTTLQRKRKSEALTERKSKEALLEKRINKMKEQDHMQLQLMKKPLTQKEANDLELMVREICEKNDNSVIELLLLIFGKEDEVNFSAKELPIPIARHLLEFVCNYKDQMSQEEKEYLLKNLTNFRHDDHNYNYVLNILGVKDNEEFDLEELLTPKQRLLHIFFQNKHKFEKLNDRENKFLKTEIQKIKSERKIELLCEIIGEKTGAEIDIFCLHPLIGRTLLDFLCFDRW